MPLWGDNDSFNPKPEAMAGAACRPSIPLPAIAIGFGLNEPFSQSSSAAVQNDQEADMSGWRFVLRSLVHHWRINLAVALGVAAATAVLTGALLVGDSVRGSLKRLTLERLGSIDEVLVTDGFFRVELADELSADAGFRQHFDSATPAILFPQGTVEKPGVDRSSRATQVVVVGCTDAFWDLGEPGARPKQLPAAGEIVLNAPLAEDLGVAEGDEVVLRLPKSNQVPADSPLGRKTDRIRSLAGLKVVDVIPADSLGRFNLRASQTTPRNAYVAIETLEDALDQEGRVNAILVDGKFELPLGEEELEEVRKALSGALQPTLADYGFSIRRIRRTFQEPGSDREDEIYDYFSLTTDRMLFEPAAGLAAQRAFPDSNGQAVFTYLANSIEKVDPALGSDVQNSIFAADRPAISKTLSPRKLNSVRLSLDAKPSTGIPYSLVSALDSTSELGPLFADDGQPLGSLTDDDIVLNSWAVADLQAKPGDRIRLAFFEPETVHGEPREQFAEFKLRAIVPLTEPSTPYRRRQSARFDQRPTPVNDPDLTPEVEGITDEESIDKWETPFKLERAIRKEDDEYWKNHRTTPKAFVSLSAGRKLWSSRFGDATSFRIPAPGDLAVGGEREDAFVRQLEQKFLAELRPEQAAFGFSFIPVKQRGLDASSGNTPFDVLFLLLSFFVISAALMLVALLFCLGVERRAGEVGTLLAVGFRRGQAGRLLIAEGALIAAVGGLLGVAVGIGYAWLMLAGLRTWWIGAIVTPFLILYMTPTSLIIGYVSGVVVSVLTIAWSLRRTKRISVTRLLAGEASEERELVYRTNARWVIAAVVLLAGSIGLAVAATRLGGQAQAGAFVGSGTLMLVALLVVIRSRLRASRRMGLLSAGISFAGLALRNGARNPGRSTMTIGLMAVASFLIVAMSAFRLRPTDEGVGGFDLMAESTEPIFVNLNSSEGRKEALSDDDMAALEGCTVLSLRMKPGDDASCNNLYQAAQPRVLGVTEQMIRHFDDPNVQSFGWAGSAAETEAEETNPWRLLARKDKADDDAVPVVIDKETAMYSLKLYKGIGEEFDVTYEGSEPIRFRVVGLLDLGILHGSLLVSEDELVERFPDVSGYRYFLIQSPPDKTDQVAAILEDRLGDQGFDATRALDRLEDLQAIQNTYLSTFQSLGALGLLLGTFGLATVQVRNVVERRSELALMRAAGFRHRRLAELVMLENIALLVGGLMTGFFAAMIAVLPHMVGGDASVPLLEPSVMLGIVLVVGVLSSLFPVRATLRAPLVSALRGD